MRAARNIHSTTIICNISSSTTRAHVPTVCRKICVTNILRRSEEFPGNSIADGDPGILARALRYGFAEHQLVVAGFERGESTRRADIALRQITIKILEQLHERVRIAFRMSTRIGRVAA